MSFVLGIDGGGSKTAAAVSNGASVFLSQSARGCNLNTVPRDTACAALKEAVQGALAAARILPQDISAVCAGIAGAASSEVAAKISAILAELIPEVPIRVVGDAVIALEAAFSGGPGVVCISGTGSVALGRNERGDSTRAGGWGRMVSDEGSGHWIGQRAVSGCLRALDQGRSSGLIQELMEHWHIVTREQLVLRCHSDSIPNFSDLFPVVLRAADAGDPLANEILSNAAVKLARITQIVLRRLWQANCYQQVAITGSVFAHSERVRYIYGNLLRSDRPDIHIRLSHRHPIEGALDMAWKSLGSSKPQAAS
jgi:N-acetylglucosamine kinase-like BadF-type ATPase